MNLARNVIAHAYMLLTHKPVLFSTCILILTVCAEVEWES